MIESEFGPASGSHSLSIILGGRDNSLTLVSADPPPGDPLKHQKTNVFSHFSLWTPQIATEWVHFTMLLPETLSGTPSKTSTVSHFWHILLWGLPWAHLAISWSSLGEPLVLPKTPLPPPFRSGPPFSLESERGPRRCLPRSPVGPLQNLSST